MNYPGKMSEETNDRNMNTEADHNSESDEEVINEKKGVSNEVKYDKVLKKQSESLKAFLNTYQYNPLKTGKLVKYNRKLEARTWLESLKKYLKDAGKSKPYSNIIRGLLNINNADDLLKNSIYGLKPETIINMMREVVGDEKERELRVWEVSTTLEEIANSFGFQELCEEIYRANKDSPEIQRLKESLVYFDEDDGIGNFDFAYLWYVVNTCHTGALVGTNHPKLIRFDKLMSGEVALEHYKKGGIRPETHKYVTSEYLRELREIMEDEHVREACLLTLAGVYGCGIMERVAMGESVRKIYEEANNIIREKRGALLPELWKEMELEKYHGEGKLVNRKKRMIIGGIQKGCKLVSIHEGEGGYGVGYKRVREYDDRYDERYDDGRGARERTQMKEIPRGPTAQMMGLKRRGNGFKRKKPEGYELFQGKIWCEDCGGPHRPGNHYFDRNGYPIESKIRNDIGTYLNLEKT